MKIGITGATGQLGHLVVNKLKENLNTNNLVALVRTPEKAASLEIEAKSFDYSSTDLEPALQGIDTLLLISGSEIGQREQQHKNVIHAAKNAGVKKIVYTSLLHADHSTSSLATEHFATEQAIKESGLNYTILRNGWYTENYTGSVPTAIQAGAFIGSANDGKISLATRSDYADAAVKVLTTEGHDKKTYELAGDESYTLQDLAAEISKQTGKNIPYNNLPEQDYANILTSAGLPQPFAQAIASFDVSAANNDLFDDSKTLSQLIGRPTTPLAETIKNTLG